MNEQQFDSDRVRRINNRLAVYGFEKTAKTGNITKYATFCEEWNEVTAKLRRLGFKTKED